MTSVDSIVARLTTLHPKRIDLSLDRMWRILDALGHPERGLPPVIHVAGTNGKGSTIAFMRAVLEAGGLRAHVYTSPHLVRFNERFRLGAKGNGALVSDNELAETLTECERANADAPITVFEITTAAALLLFARHPADVAGCNQCRGSSPRNRHHAGFIRPCRASRRYHRSDRR
jgi:dihydrofolate synthase/folylpolyglutamate synthase